MTKKRQTYSEEFKLEAVQQWQDSGKSAAEVAKDLGISKSSLYKWKQELADELAQTSEARKADQAREADSETEAVDEASSSTNIETDTPTEKDEQVTEEEEKSGEAEVGLADEKPEAKVEATDETQEDETDEAPKGDQVRAAAAIAGSDEILEEVKEEQTESSGTKRVLKRVAGVLGVVFGAIGILLSIVVIIGAWAINTPVTEAGLHILETVEEGLNVANEGLDAAQETLTEARTILAETRESFSAEELAGRIGDIKGIIDAAQATADTAGSFVQAANSVPFLRGNQAEEEVAVTTLSEASATLSEISNALGTVEEELTNRADGQTGILAEIETRVANIQVLVQEVDQSVTEATAAIVQLQQDLPGLIDTISIIFTLLFFWLGVAQLSLLLHGWQWLRWP